MKMLTVIKVSASPPYRLLHAIALWALNTKHLRWQCTHIEQYCSYELYNADIDVYIFPNYNPSWRKKDSICYEILLICLSGVNLYRTIYFGGVMNIPQPNQKRKQQQATPAAAPRAEANM